jgi:hypothetical protein
MNLSINCIDKRFDEKIDETIDQNLNRNEISSEMTSKRLTNERSFESNHKNNSNEMNINAKYDSMYGSMSAMKTNSCDVNESHYFVPIEGYEVLEQKSRFTVFRLRVEDLINDQKWLVFRRYTDFVRLNQSLIQLFPSYRFSLPSKKWFGSNFDPIFLEERQLGLQIFLNNIISFKEVTNSRPVRQFLCLDEHNISNFELQTTHSSNSSEESVLNLQSLLKSKESEIKALRQELNHLRLESQKYNHFMESNEIQTDNQLNKLDIDIGVRDSPDGTSNPSYHLPQQ